MSDVPMPLDFIREKLSRVIGLNENENCLRMLNNIRMVCLLVYSIYDCRPYTATVVFGIPGDWENVYTLWPLRWPIFVFGVSVWICLFVYLLFSNENIIAMWFEVLD